MPPWRKNPDAKLAGAIVLTSQGVPLHAGWKWAHQARAWKFLRIAGQHQPIRWERKEKFIERLRLLPGADRPAQKAHLFLDAATEMVQHTPGILAPAAPM